MWWRNAVILLSFPDLAFVISSVEAKDGTAVVSVLVKEREFSVSEWPISSKKGCGFCMVFAMDLSLVNVFGKINGVDGSDVLVSEKQRQISACECSIVGSVLFVRVLKCLIRWSS